jgi:hypothetical protein
MVDLGVIITGAVGLAGIGGTILAARMTGTSQIAGLKLSISAENDRSRLAEKRTIYATCLASFEAMRERVVIFKLLDTEASQNKPSAWATAVAQAASDVAIAVAQLKLIAPATVGPLADALADFLREAPTTMDDYRAADYIQRRGQLCDAMRADLGEPA